MLSGAQSRRKRVLTGKVLSDCRALIQAKCVELGWHIEELGVQPDHVRLFVRVWPTTAVAEVLNQMNRYTPSTCFATFPLPNEGGSHHHRIGGNYGQAPMSGMNRWFGRSFGQAPMSLMRALIQISGKRTRYCLRSLARLPRVPFVSGTIMLRLGGRQAVRGRFLGSWDSPGD
ncbi:MAG: transposase [Isosphaeraceae bacterium]